MGILKKVDILVIGKKPPPIGGVTIHVQRLFQKLEEKSFKFEFLSVTKNLFILFGATKSTIITHIHSSSPYYRLLIVLIAKICNSKVIVTIHGDLGRFKSSFKNDIDNLAVKWSYTPILLNKESLKLAVKLNHRSILSSAFIPPSRMESLPKKLIDDIENLKHNHELLFSTNAYGRTFDKNQNEIYGIEMLIPIFRKHINYALIISDPSSAYFDYFKENHIEIPNNVYLINYQHSYFEILKQVDLSIRNTSTDGDPLSVKESLYLKTPVIATDVILRPDGCTVYKREQLGSSFNQIISDAMNNCQNALIEDGSLLLFDVYDQILNNHL